MEEKVKFTADISDLIKALQSFDKLDDKQKLLLKSLQAYNGESQKQIGILEKLRADTKRLQEAREAALDPKEIAKYNIELAATEKKLQNLTTAPQSGLEKMMGSLGSLQGQIVAAFTVGALVDFGKKIFDLTAEFEKNQAVLTNLTGSKGLAKKFQEEIKAFTEPTAFEVNEVTDAFVKLAGRGIYLTEEQMKRMGDVATVTGKDFGQLTEAIMDVSNTERWNELGIKVQKSGDKIIGTYKGVKVQQEATEEGALKMIEAFGKIEGVEESTAAVSETLGGRISTLSDTFAGLLVTIGNSVPFGIFLDALTGVVGWLKTAVDALGDFSGKAKIFFEDVWNFYTKTDAEIDKVQEERLKKQEKYDQELADMAEAEYQLEVDAVVNAENKKAEQKAKIQKEAAEKQAKEAKDRREKEAAEAKKDEEKYAKELRKLDDDNYIASIEDKNKQDQEKLRLDKDNKEADIISSKASAATKAALLYELEIEFQRKLSELRKKQNESAKQEAEQKIKEFKDMVTTVFESSLPNSPGAAVVEKTQEDKDKEEQLLQAKHYDKMLKQKAEYAEKTADIANQLIDFSKENQIAEIEEEQKQSEDKIARNEELLAKLQEQEQNATGSTKENLQKRIKDIQAANIAEKKQIEEKEKEKQRIEKEAAERKKVIQIGLIALDLAKTITAINLAAAELDASSVGTLGTGYRIANTIYAIINAGLQIAAINRTKFALGGEVVGNSHAAGGVPIEAEGGEFIVAKGIQKEPKLKAIVSAINDRVIGKGPIHSSLAVLDSPATINTIDVKELKQQLVENNSILKDIREKSALNVNIDEDGFSSWIESENRKIELKNKKYNWNG